jgi:hypothetical protein
MGGVKILGQEGAQSAIAEATIDRAGIRVRVAAHRQVERKMPVGTSKLS